MLPPTLVAALVSILVAAGAPGTTRFQPTPASAALLDRAYEAAYNLRHAEALDIAREAVRQDPDVPTTHRVLAAIVWQRILFERGAVTVDHYMSGMSDALKHLPDPSPELDREFQEALSRARTLADAALARRPDDVTARYEVGAVYGLEASYKASIEGRLSAAFRTAKRAFDAQEAVLELDPSHPQANTLVGTYRYLVSALGLPSRLFAYIVGFGGGRDRGIAMLEAAAASSDALMEAGMALVLIYSREGRHADAHAMAVTLSGRYPENRLLVLEAGATAIRAGEATAAETLLTRGLADLARDDRQKVPGERAIWLYKRGLARLNQGHTSRAATDFGAALESGPRGWMRGRILVGLGKVADLSGEREAALGRYRLARETCRQFDDHLCEDEARRLERQPFRMGAGTIE